MKAALALVAETDGDDRGLSTRSKVLDVAARHFAEHSFQGTSLRAIQREVGVNPSTVHYHFGTKEALYQAVIGQFLERIQADREARLAQVPADARGGERLRLLLRAYMAPHLEVASTPRGYDYARILAFVQVSLRDAATDMFDAAVRPVRRRFSDELAQLFPMVDRRRLGDLLAMAVGHMAMVPIYLGRKSLDPDCMACAIDEAVSFVAAGFEVLSETTCERAQGA